MGDPPHHLAKGPLVFLVLPLFPFVLIPTLVDLAAMEAVHVRPLCRLGATEVIVVAKRLPKPLEQPGIPILRKHRPDQSPPKVSPSF